MRPTLFLALLLATPLPVAAHHTGTPAIVRLTSSGDNDLPRLPAFGGYLGLVLDGGTTHPVVSLKIFDHPDVHKTLSTAGTNANPTTATSPVVAWDSDGDPLFSGLPGRQVFLSLNGVVSQVSQDPTGTSVNAAVDSKGSRVGFQSSGNLTGAGPPDTQQVYIRNAGFLVQVSRGSGTSGNVALNRLGGRFVFDSTSDPLDGHDTGVPQVWVGNLDNSPARAVTSGLGGSQHPEISSEGRLVVFESTADLAHGGADTGIPEVFAYDTSTSTFAQITADATGCTGASTRKILADWRIAFTCGNEGFYYDLRRDRRYHVQTPDGTVSGIVTAFGTYFLGISTTANLLGSGTTSGHQIYLVNLYKRPAEVVAGSPALWFPTRGIKPLH
jgi:hypothetical protein